MLGGAQALSREPVEDARDVHGGPRAGIKAAPIRPTLSHGLDTLCKIETLIATFAPNDAYRQRRRFPGPKHAGGRLIKIWGSRIGCPRSPLPRGAQVFECFRVKLAIHGQGEVNLPGQFRSIGAAYEQPIGGFPVVKPFALLRQRQHVGTGITNGAEHPAVLGREGIGRERLGEMVGREDH